MLILIAATAPNGVIGSGGKMPWHIPEEYAHFLASVAGHPVILGRRSYEEFGRDLGSSELFVLSRQRLQLRSHLCSSLDDALRSSGANNRKVFCAGGAETYCQCMAIADELWISHIHLNAEGDTRFPEILTSTWQPHTYRQYRHFEFVIYRRRYSSN